MGNSGFRYQDFAELGVLGPVYIEGIGFGCHVEDRYPLASENEKQNIPSTFELHNWDAFTY